jgi:hypothetical protein
MKKLCLTNLILMSIILLMFVSFTAVANAYEWQPYNGHEYSLTENWEPWVIAEQEAVNVGGHLATVNDQAENVWLSSTFKDVISIDRNGGTPGKGAAYIGYYFNDTAWEWISGEPVTYTNPASFFPNGGTHGYLLTDGHPWAVHGTWDAAWWVSDTWQDGVNDPWGLPPQSLKGIIERPTTVTPEPASMLLFGLGGVSLGFFRRLKRKKIA